MKLSQRIIGTAGILGAACAIGALGCSSDDKSSGSNPYANGGGTGAGGAGPVGECTNPTGLQVFFAPMYTGFDGVHEFKVPAIAQGVPGSSVVWTASDPSVVGIESDALTGGVVLKALKAGTVTVQAAGPGGVCGNSTLTITQFTPADWEAGSARYNNGQGLPPVPNPPLPPADGSNLLEAGGARPACVNCHGQTASGGVFQSVSHTPQQTGGFSDPDMQAIMTQGVIPAGGYYDSSVIPQQIWSFFHKWTLSPDEIRGLTAYLRALTPRSQGAKVDFSGYLNRGGATGAGGAVGAGGAAVGAGGAASDGGP